MTSWKLPPQPVTDRSKIMELRTWGRGLADDDEGFYKGKTFYLIAEELEKNFVQEKEDDKNV